MSILCVAIVVTSFLVSIDGRKNTCEKQLNITTSDAKKNDLALAASYISARALSDFDLGEKTSSMNKKAYDKIRSMENEERRSAALCLYYSAVAACKDKNIKCLLCDLVFIAHALATADQGCYFICTEKLASKHADDLPTNKTFETFLKAGMQLKKEGASKKKFETLIKTGIKETGVSENDDKRFISLGILIGAMVAKFVVFTSSTVAIGYITDNGNKEDKHGTAKLNSKIIRPIGQIAAASGGCFADSTVVNVLQTSGQVQRKSLKDINVGEYVESVDEKTGQSTFSPVYFMAHQSEDIKTELLRLFYKDGKDHTKSLGLSRRHLIYASKGNLINAPLTQPIRADAVNKGDHVWVMESGQLVAKEVVDIIPFVGGVRHPLTENHHIVVDGVHASVHVLNENLYRGMTAPLRFTYWLNPEWNKRGLVHKLVRFVESVKEPMFNDNLSKVIGHFSVVKGTMM